MRLRACLGLILLCSGACTHIPGFVRVDVDGSTLEFKKERVPETPAPPQVPETEAPPADAPSR